MQHLLDRLPRSSRRVRAAPSFEVFRPDLFAHPQTLADRFPLFYDEVESPLMGEGFYVTPAQSNVEGVPSFWSELGTVICKPLGIP